MTEPAKHLIVLRNDVRGQWQFSFHGPLAWWQKLLIRCCGWEIRKAS